MVHDNEASDPLSPIILSSSSPPPTDDDASSTTTTTHSSICRTIITILIWYTISNAIILSTKQVFTNHFSYPLTVTTFSNFVSFSWAFLLSRHHQLRPDKPLTKKVLMEYILPIGLCVGFEIGCSNVALELLSVSFGTILKGSTPVFTFVWALCFRLEVFSFYTMCALLTIAIGIALASLGEGQEFQALGFGLALFSNVLSGLRWAMTHRLLKGGGEQTGGDGCEEEDDKLSPLTATLYTSPATVLTILPIALAVEAKSIWNDSALTEGAEPFLVVAMLTGIATLVFCVIMSEYWLVNATSSLTLSVAGIFKEMLTIGGGLFFFSEHVDMLNVVGFFVCQIGIGSYVYLRFHKQRSAVDVYTHVVLVSEEDRAGSCPKDSIIQPDPYTDDGMELTTYDDHESLSHLHQSRSLTENHEDGNTSPGLLT